MIPSWSISQRREMVNSVLANYKIPMEVFPISNKDGPENWKLRVYGGDMDAALERIHKLQTTIINRVNEKGLETVSRREALFMYVSQWLEWDVLGGGHEKPEHLEMVDLMSGWVLVYHAMGEKHRS